MVVTFSSVGGPIRTKAFAFVLVCVRVEEDWYRRDAPLGAIKKAQRIVSSWADSFSLTAVAAQACAISLLASRSSAYSARKEFLFRPIVAATTIAQVRRWLRSPR
jgi:hypothetical protein